MRKMKIEKLYNENDTECLKTFEIQHPCPLCQFDVPGVGRLRTGEKHPSFHVTEINKPLQAEQIKETRVKTHISRSRKKSDDKMEIAYSRS
jgi:hypothetical protein